VRAALVGCAQLVSSLALAQPSATAPGAYTPVPSAPAQTLYHFTLVDGRAFEARLLGADADAFYVETATGRYTLSRDQVRMMVVGQDRAFDPQGTQMRPALSTTARPPTRSHAAGTAGFVMLYGTTVLVAYLVDDADSKLGYIPVIGPLLWTGVNDDDDFLKDGWDWLAVFVTLGQAMSAYNMIAGTPVKTKSSAITLRPLSSSSMHGFALTGEF